MNFPKLKRRGAPVAPRQPLNTSSDPFEAMSDRALSLYVPGDVDPRVDSIAEHVDSTPGMGGVAR